jgi:hypothetical protein
MNDEKFAGKYNCDANISLIVLDRAGTFDAMLTGL